MKKSLLVASLAFVSANVLGMQTDRSRDAASSSMQLISREASTSSNTQIAFVENDSQQSKGRAVIKLTDEEFLRLTDPEKFKKIEIYLGQRKQTRNYSSEQIKSALFYHFVHPEDLIKDVAEKFGINYFSFIKCISDAKLSNPKITEEQKNKALAERRGTRSVTKTARNNNMNIRTLTRLAKRRGEEPLRIKMDKEKILNCYKNGGTFEDIYKIVSNGSSRKARKKFAEVTRPKFAEVICPEISYIDKVRLVNWNMDLLDDYRKGLLTDKGRINKYKNRSIRIGNICERKIGECEDYLIRNIAQQLNYDLLKIPVKWNVVFDRSTDFTIDQNA